MCNKLRPSTPTSTPLWAWAACLTAAAAAACSTPASDDTAKAQANTLSEQGNTPATAQTSAASEANLIPVSGGSTGLGGLAGEANALLGGGLGQLANALIPSLPLPANLAQLAKQLLDPNVVAAIQKAVENNVCSSELQSFESLAQPLLTDPAGLFASLTGGTAPNLQPVNDAANAFLKCISAAVPELGTALAGAGLGVSKRATAESAALPAAGAAGELEVPSSILEVVEQLNAPPVMAALQRSRQAGVCSGEFRALESSSRALLSRAPSLLEALQSRAAEDIRPTTQAMGTFLQCMAR